LCFLKCESARPLIFTIFDITCVFIKVTLIKSRSHSLRRNNNFFLVSFRIDATSMGNRRKILREKAGEVCIPFSARPFDFARNDRHPTEINATLFIEKHSRDSHWLFPRVLREWIESTCNYYLATLRSTAMRHPYTRRL